MRSPVRQFVNNLGTVILSFLLAFVIWLSATLQDDPFATQEFADVPIGILNQPDNSVIFNRNELADYVSVRARAPRSVLTELKATDFVATMDLSSVEPGTSASVPIAVVCHQKAVRIESWTPTAQTVHLEAIRVLTMPVTIELEGQVSMGYQVSSMTVTPDRVVVQGPASFLDQLATMYGTVDVREAKANIIEQATLRPLDANGKLVPGLQWTPDRIEVRVTVQRRLGYKPDVEVVPDLQGSPAPGYRLGSVSVQPSTVTLAGLPSVLDQLPGFIETWPISVTGATGDLLIHSPLTVPSAVVVVGVDYVTVTVQVLPIQSSRAITATVEMQGVRPGWVASASPEVVDVILEGPDSILSGLKPGDVRAVVDLFNYSLGKHRVAVQVVAPLGVSVVSVIPETIEVVIAVAPTPTSTATPKP